MKLFLLSLVLGGALASAAPSESPYKNQTQNQIKSLTKDDLDGLRKGSGTPFGGMAKAAELNGLPGPRHALDFKEQLDLSPQQVKQLTSVFEKMHAKATTIGKELIEIESSMDKKLKNRELTPKALQVLVDRSAKKYGELRFSHLVAHLDTADVLSKDQISAYNRLRGYSSGDPCQSIPQGHSADMWKKHHGCK
jgi:hypothetical protein